MPKLCACGKPLHYIDPSYRRLVEGLIKRLGENVPVEILGVAYLIPRHFMALHGVKAKELKEVAEKYDYKKVR